MDGFKSNTKMNSSMPCYKTGGHVAAPKKACSGGKMKTGGGVSKKEDMKQDKAVAKKAIKLHDKNMHGGKSEDLSSLRKGGSASKKRMAKKAEGGAMMEKAPAPMPKKPAMPAKKKPLAPKKTASAKVKPKAQPEEVLPLGSPAAAAPAPDLGAMPAPMMAHGGTVHHVHTMAHGGNVEHHMDGGMAGAGLGGAMGQAVGQAAGMGAGMGASMSMDPRLMAMKKRLAALGQAGMAGGAAPAMGGMGAAGAPPQAPQPMQAGAAPTPMGAPGGM